MEPGLDPSVSCSCGICHQEGLYNVTHMTKMAGGVEDDHKGHECQAL